MEPRLCALQSSSAVLRPTRYKFWKVICSPVIASCCPTRQPGVAPRSGSGEQLQRGDGDVNDKTVIKLIQRGDGDVGDKTVIKLEGVFKVFETETVTTHALSNIDLQVERGEYIAIAGPSGCGKSTLLSILGLLDTATSGAYFLDGQPVTGLSAKQRAQVRNRQIGFIFQSFNLLGDRTVAQNVELPLR